MCGIIGIITKENNLRRKMIEGLKKLEYRGYDSWGLAIGGNKIRIEKNVGRISSVESYGKDSAGFGIGHTRWATHGGVMKINAHPHLDCTRKIAVVHNGIIENYQDLKNNLIQNGHKFISETDTEIIPHLVEEELKNETDFKLVLTRVSKKIKGSFAIALIRTGKDEIWAASCGCPLVLGQDSKDIIITSDVVASPFPQVSYLPEKTLIRITANGISVWDLKTLNKKNIRFVKNDLSQQKICLGNYKHYLLKEINEQPDVIQKISKIDEREIQTNAALIRHSFGTFFVSCGTSFHASLVGQYLFAKIAKMHINVSSASEFHNFRYFLTDKTLLLPISQSGETADVLDAAKVAQKKRTKIMSLVNNLNSTLARMSDVVIVTPAGPEIAVLSTKAFSSQIAILYLLASAATDELGLAQKNLERVSRELTKTFQKNNIEKIKSLARKIKNTKNLFVIGRGLNFPTALEAALKIKEVSYIHAEGFAGGDLKHGPIALIEAGIPCIVFVANDENKEEILSNAMEIKSRGGMIIGVSYKNNPIFDDFIPVSDLADLSPIANILPIQLLSYYLAIERGCDPDKPRNLAKSVTVK